MERHLLVFTVLLFLQSLLGVSIADVPTTLHIFADNNQYYAINISNGDVIFKQIPLHMNSVELVGVVQPSSAGDDFLLIGGNTTYGGKTYIPIMWSYNIQTNTIVQKSFINTKFQQIKYDWEVQIASYDSINNIVYLNIESTEQGLPLLLKFDFDQKKEEVITLPGTGVYIQSSYNESTNTCYLGGSSLVENLYGEVVFATYNSVSGDMSSQIIKFDVNDTCYYKTVMYQYNSMFYAGLQGSGDCSSYIFEVDIVANTSTLLATIPYVDPLNFDGFLGFVFDGVNGYLSMFSATGEVHNQKLDICLVNLNTYEVNQYTIPNPLPWLTTDDADLFVMTLS